LGCLGHFDERLEVFWLGHYATVWGGSVSIRGMQKKCASK
jgi:hypothetical protein